VRDLREAQARPASVPYVAVYHPHGEYRGYVRYQQNVEAQRRAVNQARRNLNRLEGLSARLEVSRASAGRRYRLSLEAAVLDELVFISKREVTRGEARVARSSGIPQYARN
jgi:hypothetical protein